MKIRAVNSNEVEMFLYGFIGDGDGNISDTVFMSALRKHEETHKTILLRFNSGGGDLFQGLPMYNSLRESKAEVIGIIDGLCASMATIVMCGCKRVKAASNSRIMIHGPRGGAYDTVEKVETVVENMKGVRKDMAKVYAAKTGRSEKWVMDNWLTDGKDHWFSAQEALDAGLIDEIIQVAGKMAAVTDGDLKMVAAFYEEQLLEQTNKQTDATMKNSIVALNATGHVKLPETATDESVATGIKAVGLALSAKEQEITQLNAKITSLEKDAADAKVASLKDRATTMVEAALSANKIVADQKESYITLASASEEGFAATKSILDKMKGYEPVGARLSDKKGEQTADFSTLSATERKEKWDALHKDGTLATLKAENKEAYDLLFAAKFSKS